MAATSGLRVLVVEDNPADAMRVREALETQGQGRFHPTFAGGLKDAERRLAAADLVLLDLSLPDSSGVETVARVRAMAPGTPVVVLSGERDEGLAFRCLQHGAQDVLLKGAIDGDGLVRALSCALERQALAKERDEALARARAGEAQVRAVLGAIPEGIVVADPCGRALFVNEAADLLLGWKPGTGPGRTVELPLKVGEVQEAGRSGRDGRPRVLQVRTAAIRWDGIPATLSSIHEISQPRRRPTGGRSPGSPHLEEERREPTRRLASGIARGLGENLAVVLEGAFELSDGHESAAYGPALKIQRAGWQATALIRQLLACAGEAKEVPELLDLGEVVASHWGRVEERLTASVAFEKCLAGALPRVRADRRLIEQALLALVDHARNSLQGNGTVTVRTALEPPAPGEARSRVVLSVSDTGPGLAPPECQRLFEPFYATEVLGIGTGLGLAPVLGIALQSGGTADVQSAAGRGTTVRILLPVAEESPIPVAEGTEKPLPGGKETVLVAVGDPWLRGRISSTLQDLGYRVYSEATAGDAVRLAVTFRGPIPILLAELRATGMGGAVLTGVLRCRRPGMRALLLTDAAGGKGGPRMAGAGSRILERPFDREELAREVRSLLDSPREGAVALEEGGAAEAPGPDPLPGGSFPPGN